MEDIPELVERFRKHGLSVLSNVRTAVNFDEASTYGYEIGACVKMESQLREDPNLKETFKELLWP
jgi:hypothetical protein